MSCLRRKNSICILLVFALLVVLCFYFEPVQAVNEKTNRGLALRWSHFTSVSCDLSINGSGVAHIEGEATANPTNTNSVKISIVLQKQGPSGVWSYIKTFSASGVSEAWVSENYTLKGNGNYRIVMNAVANNNESASCTSSSSY